MSISANVNTILNKFFIFHSSLLDDDLFAVVVVNAVCCWLFFQQLSVQVKPAVNLHFARAGVERAQGGRLAVFALDFDVDIKIGVKNNIVSGKSGYVHAPLSFKVPRSQSEEAKEIIHLVKEYYLL